MNKFMQMGRLFTMALALVAASAVVSCSDDNNDNPEPTPQPDPEVTYKGNVAYSKGILFNKRRMYISFAHLVIYW